MFEMWKRFYQRGSGSTFTPSSDFQEHATLHPGKRSFVSDVSEKSLIVLSTLRSQRTIDMGERRYLDVFPSDGEMAAQQDNDLIPEPLEMSQLKKPRMKGSEHRCSICAEEFISHSLLLRHEEEHKKRKEGEYMCKHCDSTFSVKFELIRHESTHPHNLFLPALCAITGLW